jgi:hypothetical protein
MTTTVTPGQTWKPATSRKMRDIHILSVDDTHATVEPLGPYDFSDFGCPVRVPLALFGTDYVLANPEPVRFRSVSTHQMNGGEYLVIELPTGQWINIFAKTGVVNVLQPLPGGEWETVAVVDLKPTA